MGHSIGNVVPSKIMAGANPVKKVYVGADQVWPVVTAEGLYGVRVAYLDNYVVNFTALTSYAPDPEEAFFFRSTPITNDGYVAREFSKTYRASGVPMDCVLEEYWVTPSGVRNTINFKITPRATGNGVVEEIIP
jgi:hypothetical protein